MSYELIVVGTSAGGIDALKLLLTKLSNPRKLPIIILQHLNPQGTSYLPSIIHTYTGVKTMEVGDKMEILENTIYTPAPNYHMLMEKDWTISLNVEERVSYARPSIDVLFESVADALKDKVIGILLTGANHDGAAGLKAILDKGGYTMVQDPSSAYAREMPLAAIKKMNPNFIGSIIEIKQMLENIIKDED